MQPDRRLIVLSCAAAAATSLLMFGADVAHAVPAYTGGTYGENFDSLINSPTNTALPQNEWSDDTTIAGGYYLQTLLTDNEGGYQRLRAGSGNSATGSLYSYGTNGSTDRALGFLDSNTLGPVGQTGMWFALRLRNDTTDTTYTNFVLKYNGEQWRNGGNTAVHSLDFSYGLDALGLQGANYTAVSGLSFFSPVTGSTAAAVDGNSAGRVAINSDGSLVISGINWEPGQDLWLRWTDTSDPGNDHGLGIDDIQFTAGGAVTGSPSSRSWAGTGGNWSDSSKWLNGTVGGAGALARFASTMSADTTINLDTSPTVAGLVMNATTHNYTLTADPGQQLNIAAGGAVTVSNSAFAKTLDTSSRSAPDNMTNSVPSGVHVISAPLHFAGNGTIGVGDLATLSVTGSITADSGGGITKTGSGTLVLTAANTYSGPTTIQGGLVSFSDPNQLGDGSPTNGIVIQNGAGISPTADMTMTRPFSFDAAGARVQSDKNITFGNLSGPGVFSKVGPGNITVGTLNVAGLFTGGITRDPANTAGVFQIAPDSATSRINALRLETDNVNAIFQGKLDLTNNKLVYDYDSAAASPLTNAPSLQGLSATTVARALFYARVGTVANLQTNGSWTNTGITSSWINSPEHDPDHIRSVAYAEASGLLGLSGAATATWNGQTVDATTLILAYTYAGDANLDGKIDGDDYAIVDRSLARGTFTTVKNTIADAGKFAQWIDGDFNYDGAVDSNDLLILDHTLAILSPSSLSPALLADREARFGIDYVNTLLTSVPEPASLSLLAVAAAPLLTRRRRSR